MVNSILCALIHELSQYVCGIFFQNTSPQICITSLLTCIFLIEYIRTEFIWTIFLIIIIGFFVVIYDLLMYLSLLFLTQQQAADTFETRLTLYGEMLTNISKTSQNRIRETPCATDGTDFDSTTKPKQHSIMCICFCDNEQRAVCVLALFATNSSVFMFMFWLILH